MKKYLLILALCGSVHAGDLDALDRYWAERGWYREEGSNVYQTDYPVKTQIIIDEVNRVNQEKLDRIEKQQKEILRRLEEEGR